MRFLIVSNLFPPCFMGGYEIGASWVAQALREAGHKVSLMTCSQVFLGKGDHCEQLVHVGCPPAADEWIDAGACFYGIDVLDRLLLGESGAGFASAKSALERHFGSFTARRAARAQAILHFAPDVILLFNPACILDPVLAEFALLPSLASCPILSYISDDWRIAWEKSNPLIFLWRFFQANRHGEAGRLADSQSRLLDDCREWEAQGVFEFLLPPRIDRVFFCSRALQVRYQQEFPSLVPGQLLPWGLPGVRDYPSVPASSFAGSEPLKLGYSGQIEPHKGLYDLLHALLLCERPHRLVVCGDDTTAHAKFCRAFAESSELAGRVEFLGRLPPGQVWTTLAERSEIYVLPSRVIAGLFQEPFSIGLLQAMATGLAVISSDSGGSPEAINNGEDGLLFRANTPPELAQAIDKLERDRPGTGLQAAQARAKAGRCYTIEIMAATLLTIASDAAKDFRRTSPASFPATHASVFYLLHNASRDPANSGCVRVARRLAHELQQDVRPWFVRWNETLGSVTFINEGEADYLGRFNGPDQVEAAEPGRLHGCDVPIHLTRAAPQMVRSWLILPELIDADMLRSVIHYAKRHQMLCAAIFYDAIPLLRPELCSAEIRSNHASYMDALARCDLVLPISHFSARCLSAHWKQRQVEAARVVPLLLPGEFKQGQASAEIAPRPGIEILCVSTLEPRKNHARLLAALALVSENTPHLDWRLSLVGNSYAGAPEVTQQVEVASLRDPRIVWHRIVDDRVLGELYQRADFTVYPSIIEGYGLPIVESIWYGRPCICSDSGVMAELAADGGCLTVNVEDPLAIAQAIIDLGTNETYRQKLTLAARNRLLKSWRQYGLEVTTALQVYSPVESRIEKHELPALDEIMYPSCLDTGGAWPLSHAERATLSTLLFRLRPAVAIEIGPGPGGSLCLLRQFSAVVFFVGDSVDQAARFSHMDNVTFVGCPVAQSLPLLLAELRSAGVPTNFAFVDLGNSSTELAEIIRTFLAVRPLTTTYLLIRGSFDPQSREEILSGGWVDCPYVHSLEIDQVQGTIVDQVGDPDNGRMRGGFTLATLHRSTRVGPLKIRQSGRNAYERCHGIRKPTLAST